MKLPNGRRADIVALRPDGGFACIEVKSGLRDFLTDSKWPEYRAYADALYFAVAQDFPIALLPPETGLIVAVGLEADLLREPQRHPLAPARRQALLRRPADRRCCGGPPTGVAAAVRRLGGLAAVGAGGPRRYGRCKIRAAGRINRAA